MDKTIIGAVIGGFIGVFAGPYGAISFAVIGGFIGQYFDIKEKKKERKKRILLTEEDFDALVSGEEVRKEGIRFLLQDIGYSRMMNIIDNKIFKLNKDEPNEAGP
jgi:uncharacterized protein YcfJ